jgi:hypothetical protein
MVVSVPAVAGGADITVTTIVSEPEHGLGKGPFAVTVTVCDVETGNVGVGGMVVELDNGPPFQENCQFPPIKFLGDRTKV